MTISHTGPLDTTGDTAGDTDAAFTLAYDGVEPRDEGLRETLTSTGNGYMATRGAAEWEEADDVHYPGTYVHGLYDRATTLLGGVPVHNEDLVNLPNWLPLKLRVDGAEVLRLADVEVLDYRHRLDLRAAVLTRHLRFRDREGRETELVSRRFTSMASMHHAYLEWTLTPLNWSGPAEVVSAIDGRVTNDGVPRYRDLEGTHLHPVGTELPEPEVMALKTRTRQSEVTVSVAARTRVLAVGQQVEVSRTDFRTPDHVQQTLHLDLERGVPVTVEKSVALFTSRDPATGETLVRAHRSVTRSRPFESALAHHRESWSRLWQACDVQVFGDDEAQHLLRVHISHILQTCSPNTADLDAGVPARGINGEAYRGHVFWDELFVLPFLTYRLPGVTRSLLMYRYRRLAEARAAARAAGRAGFMFPWQSGSLGTEETQEVHLNPMSGTWDVDLSHNQRHVSAAIFYNVWQYITTTEDTMFLESHGAELMLGIARFWSSAAHYSSDRERYEIHGVMGPDEYHEKYPGAAEGGLRNNAYTNVFVAWICDISAHLLDLLPAPRADAVRARLELRDEEIERWKDMSRRMFVPFHYGIISQFEGYADLEELDWDAYRAKYGDIQRLDRILKAEGDTPDRYKLAKQADAVMLFFLFGDEELRRVFTRLGYEFPDDAARRTIEYYDRRTSHGSTLSYITHAGVLARFDPDSSWERFTVALRSDVSDIQGGTTREGIHMGVMAGTVDLVQRFYAGMRAEGGMLHLEPNLPGAIDGVSFTVIYPCSPLTVTVMRDEVVIRHRDGVIDATPVRVRVAGEERLVAVGAEERFSLV
ncbi:MULTISPECIES: glycoside hydrolase family 65 protein [Dietzia]|uniref:glycoside hydrolase family 65 protein n=1 Tax=Dietzia TaxID=37914 RepID=UPI000D08CFF6|nr:MULTISPECIES: glycosyl hydrolase family 65 protein [Dietzia]AVM64348.1 trehalose 6-phosphate phosphorylase [Dietzia sp. oral taxon 368]MCT2274973.1 glycoside hydrolase family 65 protein [Dietzia cinnamea]